MFERFTDRARRVVVLAQEEARGLNHNYIGTEHLLLGLIHEEGIAANVLGEVGLNLAGTRTQIESLAVPGMTTPQGHIPFTPRSKKVLELGLKESMRLGHEYIGTEHILLGLLVEGEGVACQVLKAMDIGLDSVRNLVFRAIEEAGSDPDVETTVARVQRARPMSEQLEEIIERLSRIESRLDRLEREPNEPPSATG